MTTVLFNLKKQVWFLDLLFCFPFFLRVLLIKVKRLLIFYQFSVATTLVTLSSKEKHWPRPEISTPSFGLGIDPSMLEPGTGY
jgi:hypothetical protein